MEPSESVISIVGGGWSAKNVALAALPGTIIGVNDAGLLAPKIDIILSMDRLWLENRWHELEALQKQTFVRLSAMHNLKDRLTLPWVTAFECNHTTAEFGDNPKSLNGPNSGHCALNLAYVMKPKVINLVGFDMGRGPKGEVYWFKPYKWSKKTGATSNGRYAEWKAMFDQGVAKCIADGIEIRRL